MTKYASTTHLILLVLDSIGMLLSPFYQQVLHVHASIPVCTPHGICMDSDGNIGHFNDGDYPNDDLKQYFYMEYNELSGGEGYKPQVFQVQ